MPSNRLPPCSSQSGFTLVEVLVAVIILSIGLLGLAGLQAAAIRANDSSYQRSQAAMLAYSIADSMRANRPAVLTGGYDTDCTSPANADLTNWCTTVSTALPGGTGSITRVTNTFRVTITVQWNDLRAGGPSNQQFVIATQI